MYLTRDGFFGLPNGAITGVKLPDGEYVCVREMSGLAREQFEEMCRKCSAGEEIYSMRALLTVFCTCDATGNLLFSPEDLDRVSQKPASILDAIYRAAIELNTLGELHLAELAKNSAPATDGDSPTA
jgi:hypothetical protein